MPQLLFLPFSPSWYTAVLCWSYYLTRQAHWWKIKAVLFFYLKLGCSCFVLPVRMWVSAASTNSVCYTILLLAIQNQSQPSCSLFQVSTAALRGWGILHSSVRGCGKADVWMPSLQCRAAIKSSPNCHPCICSAHQRLDATGLLAWHLILAKFILSKCCI